MITTQKANKIVIYRGHDASCPEEKLGIEIVRAQ